MAPGTDNLVKLLRRATLDDHDEVLQSAEAVLKTSKDDVQAQHVKIVSLLKLDRYADALQFLESTKNQDLEQRARLERAYGLYKLGKWTEARNVAQGNDAGRGLKHVEAQAAYRLEQFQGAAQLYAQLTAQLAEVENEDVDLKINSGAIQAQLQWAGQGYLVPKTKPTREDLEAFETTYNAACMSIGRGELRQADILLKRAIDLCNALEDWSEEEKNAESSPIIAQRIYVLSKLDKMEEAAALYQNLPLGSISDRITRTIARNNSMLFSKESSNPYMLQRLFTLPDSKDINDTPFQFQARLLQRNQYTLDLKSQKSDGVVRSTSAYLAKQSMSTISSKVNTISVMNAAAHIQNATHPPSLRALERLFDKRPKDVGLLLTIVQLHMLNNWFPVALLEMRNFMKRLEEAGEPADLEVRFAPGLVFLLVMLLQAQDQKEQTRLELKKAAHYWRKKGPASAPLLLRVAGAELLKSTKTDDISTARGIFESLHNQDPNDRVALAGLVAATAADEDATTASFSDEIQSFTPISRLTAGIDAAALEEAGVPRPPERLSDRPSKKKEAKRKAEETNPSQPVKKKRVRKSRLPNEENRKKPIDPERWLPLRDRSTYRPKGKKAKAKATTLTQGGVVVGNEGGGQDSKGERAKGKGKKGKR